MSARGIAAVRSPLLVGLIAILLPGVGQVVNEQPQRGLTFLFFLLLGGWISFHLTTPDHSMIGRLAGGVFVYAMSILDAYKWARVRYEQAAYQRQREGR